MTGIEYSAEKGGAYLGSHLSSTCIPIPRDSVVQSECEHSPAFHKAEQSAPTRPLPHSQTGIQTVQCIIFPTSRLHWLCPVALVFTGLPPGF